MIERFDIDNLNQNAYCVGVLKKVVIDALNLPLDEKIILIGQATGQSIEYIKRINEIMLIAVRVKQHGYLWVKSIFSITDAKLNAYIQAGRVKIF